jgi:hypothetical protein
VRGGDSADVIVVKTIGAELKLEVPGRLSLGRRRGPRPADDDDAPEPVAITRVTVVRGSPFADDASAREWLARCRDDDTADREIAEALRLLNRAILAHRVSAGDPYAADAARGQARRIRIGFGSGDELVEGRSREVHEVPLQTARRSRRRMLAPEEQVAQILGGRRPTWPSEDLLLRVRLDLDQGRTREAALQAQAAHGSLAAELAAQPGADEGRSAVERQDQLIGRLGAAALDRELDEVEMESLGEAVAEMERVVRRRRHALDVRGI